ncbi:NUDIX hydrolase [Sutcliffiella horikoshii]|uniref:NUDIX hydrolase n=1 Tax=Sutcliffiella horikoshii TaxID=79883 RepID=UPI003CEC7FFF
MRDRGSVVIIEAGRVILIKRVTNESIYYVFPGGGIEEGETPEEAAKREAFEELGVMVYVDACLSTVEYSGKQFFFLANIVDGEIGTGKGEEFNNLNRDRGTYEPMWVDIDNLSSIDVKPRQVAHKIQSLFK